MSAREIPLIELAEERTYRSLAGVFHQKFISRLQVTALTGTQRTNHMAGLTALIMMCAAPFSAICAQAAPVDWSAVDAAMGRPSISQPGDVHRYNIPRGDLTVTVTAPAGDVRIRPALALGGWIAMHPTGHVDSAMVMGDLVLTENEISPVISALQAGGVEQSALHHHVLHESPRVFYMHVHAMGSARAIAATIRSAVALTGAPPAPPSAASAPLDLDTVSIAGILGRTGRVNGGVYQVSVPRAESIMDGMMLIPAAMGLGTAINFQPTGGGKAAITGDFVLLAAEVNPVIRALRRSDIEVTSLHNHMLTDEPRLFFMHFWANADASALARGLRAALDLTNSQRPTP